MQERHDSLAMRDRRAFLCASGAYLLVVGTRSLPRKPSRTHAAPGEDRPRGSRLLCRAMRKVRPRLDCATTNRRNGRCCRYSEVSFPNDAPRSLAFENLHTGEKLQAEYWADGDYAPDALGAINHLLRDFRTGDVHAIEPQLLDTLALLHMKLDSKQPFQVLSGYRSPATNAMLYATTTGVSATSLHMLGQAIDIFLPGCELTALRDAARALNIGGVGYYPGRFVHVDVGPVKWW